MKSVEINITGYVQGVGFRYFVYQNANHLGLNGFVKNLIDGSVFIRVEGDIQNIEQLIKLVSKGPQRSLVRNCNVKNVEYLGIYNRFIIDK